MQEYRASRAVELLKRRLSHKTLVWRDGTATTVAADEVVSGDIVKLSAGDLVPADGIILEARDLNISEFTLTGESFPVVKSPGISPQTQRSASEGTPSSPEHRCAAGTANRAFSVGGPRNGIRTHRQGGAARVICAASFGTCRCVHPSSRCQCRRRH